ncbi:unnamed protein product [Periconia digitata]|uniref:RING-type domain-containing protein n=1 Tax=Periconia digitata TaxID=1303443 RepID=A0A9W4UAA0_9PLEO|nr:unnamed protein product [Periconia digitata]
MSEFNDIQDEYREVMIDSPEPYTTTAPYHPSAVSFLANGTRPIDIEKAPEPRCPTCLEEYSDFCHKPVQIQSCGHVFGYDCLARWVEEHNTCPILARSRFD